MCYRGLVGRAELVSSLVSMSASVQEPLVTLLPVGERQSCLGLTPSNPHPSSPLQSDCLILSSVHPPSSSDPQALH